MACIATRRSKLYFVHRVFAFAINLGSMHARSLSSASAYLCTAAFIFCLHYFFFWKNFFTKVCFVIGLLCEFSLGSAMRKPHVGLSNGVSRRGLLSQSRGDCKIIRWSNIFWLVVLLLVAEGSGPFVDFRISVE